MRFINRAVTPSQCQLVFERLPDLNFQDDLRAMVTNKSEANNTMKKYHLVQVADHLYMGSIEAAYNEPILCRYRIDSLVDISAVHPNQVAHERKSICPCTCPLQIAHSRARLTISIEDREDEDIVQFFREINKFIHTYRIQGRNVLVFSNAALSRAPTIIAQYLIQFENRSLASIMTEIVTFNPATCINGGFFKVLTKIERKAARKRSMAAVWKMIPSVLHKRVAEEKKWERSGHLELINAWA